MALIARTNAADIAPDQPCNAGPVSAELNNIINNSCNPHDIRLDAAESGLNATVIVANAAAAEATVNTGRLDALELVSWAGHVANVDAVYSVVTAGVHTIYQARAGSGEIILPDPAGFALNETYWIFTGRNLGSTTRLLTLTVKANGGGADRTLYLNDRQMVQASVQEDSGGNPLWALGVSPPEGAGLGVLSFGTSATITYAMDNQGYYPWDLQILELDFSSTDPGETNTLVLWDTAYTRHSEVLVRFKCTDTTGAGAIKQHANDGGATIISRATAFPAVDTLLHLKAVPGVGWVQFGVFP